MAVTSSHPSPKRFRPEVVFLVVVAAMCGALSGAAAGFLVSETRVIETPVQVVRTTTTTTPIVPLSTTTLALVPATRTPATAVVPPAFLSRRSSPIATLYHVPKGTTIEDRMLDTDHPLGQAIALTSDGWFVTSADVLTSVPLANVTLWHDGASYPIERGILDSSNGTAYLKTSASGLTPTAFAHVAEFSGSEAVWTETRAGQLAPAVVLDVRYRFAPSESASSESIARRIVVSGMSVAGDAGSAVWDPDGSLVGLVESAAGEPTRLVPASSIAASFASLLATGSIAHASLGVRAIDLADIRFAGSRGTLPMQGAWIHDDKKTGKPGIVVNSAAAKAKLKDGDVILEVERDILDGTADLGEILSDYRPGTSVTLRVHRATGDVDVPVQLSTVVTSQTLK